MRPDACCTLGRRRKNRPTITRRRQRVEISGVDDLLRERSLPLVVTPLAPGWSPDLNGDGFVDAEDMLDVIRGWGPGGYGVHHLMLVIRKWGAIAQAGPPFVVNEPRPPLRALGLSSEGFLALNNSDDAIGGPFKIDDQEYGIRAEGQWSDRVVIDGFRARNCWRYGAWIQGSDFVLRDFLLHQRHDATEHGCRIYGERIVLENGTIDSMQVAPSSSPEVADGKSCLWLVDVRDVFLHNVQLRGGEIRLGARPNDDQGVVECIDIEFRGGVIDHTRPDMPSMMAAWPGTKRVLVSGVTFKGHGRVCDFEDATVTDVEFRGCWRELANGKRRLQLTAEDFKFGKAGGSPHATVAAERRIMIT